MRRLISIFFLLLFNYSVVFSLDFSAVSPSNHTLYYSVYDKDSNYVNVTYPGASPSINWDGYAMPEGKLIIPSTVTNNGIIYKVKGISSDAFWRCQGIKSVEIPNTVVAIGYAAFLGCDIDTIIIPNSVQTVSDLAFSSMHGIKEIIGCDSVYYIGDKAFDNKGPWYDKQPDGIVYVGSVAYLYKGQMPTDTHLVFPEGTLGIASRAFQQQSNISSISFPETLLSIGEQAFSKCGGIESVTIQSGVIRLGAQAFMSCGKLSSVRYNAVKANIQHNIAGYSWAGHHDVFYSCNNLTSFIIGEGVEIIPDGAFNGMEHVSSIDFPTSLKYIGRDSFDDCTGITHLTIPENVNHLAYSSLKNITSVDFNAINCSTDGSPFSSSQITDYSFGPNVQRIPKELFANCTKITGHLIIPNTVKVIEERAFSGCTGITRLTIGNSVDSIGSLAFYNMTSLNVVHYNATQASDRTDNHAFLGTTAISELIIGNNVITIPDYLFNNLPNLTSVVFPETLEEIGMLNFCSSGLTGTLTLPASIKEIGAMAFSSSSSITEIKCNATVPPTVIPYGNNNYYIFNSLLLRPLYVPNNSIEEYKKAPGWSYFENILGLYSDDGINLISDNEINLFVEDNAIIADGINSDVTIKVYNIIGQSVNNRNLSAGLYFVIIGDQTVQKIVVEP